MIAGLKPYAEYKESGVSWMGVVPREWRVERTKWVFRSAKELNLGRRNTNVLSLTLRGVVNNNPDSPEGMVPKDYATYQIFRKHDLVFKLIDLENIRTSRVGLVHEDGIMSSAYVRLVPSKAANVRFFYFQFFDLYTRAIFNALGAGVRSTLGSTDLGELRIAIPQPDEQAAIVRFLDHATHRLDRAIRAKRKTIALLNEQKQAIIHRAVTRGLDPDVKLKDSGIPWLGQIPAHWEVMPLKRTCSLVRDGTHLPPARTLTGFPLLSVRNMVGGRLVRRADDSFISKADFEQLNSSFVVRPNDVLMAIVGATLGKVAVVDDIGPFHIQRSVSILRPRSELMSHAFLATFLRSPRLQQHLWQSVAFSAQPGIYLGFVANIPVPVPPTIAEQVSICDGLQRELSPIGTAISRIEREIDLLREYRTRLIADVVTGKLDVREAAARLPEVEDAPAEDAEIEEGNDELAEENA